MFESYAIMLNGVSPAEVAEHGCWLRCWLRASVFASVAEAIRVRLALKSGAPWARPRGAGAVPKASAYGAYGAPKARPRRAPAADKGARRGRALVALWPSTGEP